MKILIATGLYPPDIGGPATHTLFLEKNLPTHGISYAVVPFGSVRKYPPLIRHLVYAVKLLRAGRSCDALYALDTVSVGFPCMLAAILLRKPFYLRVPGDYAWEQGQQRWGLMETLDAYLEERKHAPFFVRLFAFIQTRVARRATHVIVPSDYMKRVVTSWGIDAHRITRVYSALQSLEVREPKEVLRKQFGLKGFVVMTAARLVPWKGVSALIDAIASLRKEGFDVSLQVVGDGPLRETLRKRAWEKGIAECVYFQGAVSHDLLAKYLKASDAFVLNTSYEGMSHQLLEVMSLGIPVITTPVGGNEELITHMQEGILVPFNDTEKIKEALKELCESEQLRSALVAHARLRLSAFSEDTSIREIVSVLKNG